MQTTTTTELRSEARELSNGTAPERPQRAWLETGLIGVGLIALLVFLGHHVYSDAEVRYQSLSNLLLHGRLDQSKYSLIGPLFSTPVWIVGGWLHLPHRGVGLYNWCVFTCGIGAFYWLLKDRMDRHVLRTFILLLIAGSMFPFHLTNYYGEVFTAVLVAVGLVAVQVGWTIPGWIAIVLGVANTPATLVALGLVVLVRLHQTRRLRSALPLVAAAGLIAAENWIRRGSPFASDYESGFVFPFFGLLSIFFAFGKGLIFFTPGLFLPVKRALQGLAEPARRLLASIYAPWVAFVAGMVVVYSSWWAWDGGWFWGPRFFLFASFPAALVLALRLHRRGINPLGHLATLVVLALSFWVDINGAVFGDYALFNLCAAKYSPGPNYCNYLPRDSVLWYPLWVHQPLNWMSLAYIVYCVAVFVYLAAPLVRAMLSATYRMVRQNIHQGYLQGWRV